MKVTFQIENGNPVTIEGNPGDNLLELARRANVAIDAPCSGNGSCGKCRVKLVEGELDAVKSRHLSDEEFEAGWRLSCNSRVKSDCTVLVPDIASAYRSRMKIADLTAPREKEIFLECQSRLQESGVTFENEFLALDVAMVITSMKLRCSELSARADHKGGCLVTVTVEVRNTAELTNIRNRLAGIRGVRSVTRGRR